MRRLLKIRRWKCLAVASGALLLGVAAHAQVRIALIDPMSGPFANFGDLGVKHFQMAAADINARGGVLGGQKIEIVPMDGKGSPQESSSAANGAIGQGIRLIASSSSNVVSALVDLAGKTASRDPARSFLVLNYAGADPEQTNGACSFWHFRFYPHSDMQMDVLTKHLTEDKNVKKVYIIGQDYTFGRQFAKTAKEMIAKKRADVQIVGDDLHPLGQVKDFAPYVARIAASGADTVVTGNYGNDLALLVRAAKDYGLKANFYTFYAGGLGAPTAIGDAGVERVRMVTEWHANIANDPNRAYADAFRKHTGIDFVYLRVNVMMQMLANAINTAGSMDPVAVGRALENMKINTALGEVMMNKADHQILMPLYVSTYAKKDGKNVKYDMEGSGVGTRTELVVSARDGELPTTCKMRRPE